jgi:hypothetical protein
VGENKEEAKNMGSRFAILGENQNDQDGERPIENDEELLLANKETVGMLPKVDMPRIETEAIMGGATNEKKRDSERQLQVNPKGSSGKSTKVSKLATRGTASFKGKSGQAIKKGPETMSKWMVTDSLKESNSTNFEVVNTLGHKYTWRGPLYHGGQRIFERLDRALCNDKWRLDFPDGVVKVLTRLNFSDHHPLLITPMNAPHPVAPRQFRFESAWLLDNSYNEMLSNSWKRNQTVVDNLSTVQNKLKQWKF